MNPAYAAVTTGPEVPQSLSYNDGMAHSRSTVSTTGPVSNPVQRMTVIATAGCNSTTQHAERPVLALCYSVYRR